MDRKTFITELETLQGCQFMYLHESRKIEGLVQSYLESPKLHNLDHNRRLVYHLLNSEYAPLQRIARTGLQPGGFLVRRFPQVGPFVAYVGFAAIWALSIWYLFSPLRTSQAWALLIPLLGFTIYHVRSWLRLRALTADVQKLFDREILSGQVDPKALFERLSELGQRGLKIHPHVFTLLELQQHLQSPAIDS